MRARGGPLDNSEAGPRHRDRPTAENTAAAKLQVPDQYPTSARQRQARRALTAVVEPDRVRGDHEVAALACWPAGHAVSTDAELLTPAEAHVRRVRRWCPQARAVDPAAHLAAVVEHLRPLPADRAFPRPTLRCRGGEPSWIGGTVGLHVPRVRKAA